MAFIDANNKIKPATPQSLVPGESLVPGADLTNMIRAARAKFPENKALPDANASTFEAFTILYPIYRNMWIYRYLANPASNWMGVTEALVLKRIKKPSEFSATINIPRDNIGAANVEWYTKFNAFLTWAAHADTPVSRVFDQYESFKYRFTRDNDIGNDNISPSDFRIVYNRINLETENLNPASPLPPSIRLINDQRWRTLRIMWNSIAYALIDRLNRPPTEDEKRSLITRIQLFLKICESYMVTYNQPIFPEVNIYRKTSIRNRPLNALEAAQYIDNNFRLRILNLVMNFSPVGVHDALTNTHNIIVLQNDGIAFNFSNNDNGFSIVNGYKYMFDVFTNDRPFINHLTTNIKEDNAYKQAVNTFAQEIRKNGTIKNTSFDAYFNATISTWFSKLRYGIMVDIANQRITIDDSLRIKQLYVDLRTSGVRFTNATVDFRAALSRAASAKPAKGTIVTEASLQKWLDRIFIETIKAIPTNNIKADTEYLLGEPEKVYRSGSLYQNLIHLMGSEAKILELL